MPPLLRDADLIYSRREGGGRRGGQIIIFTDAEHINWSAGSFVRRFGVKMAFNSTALLVIILLLVFPRSQLGKFAPYKVPAPNVKGPVSYTF